MIWSLIAHRLSCLSFIASLLLWIVIFTGGLSTGALAAVIAAPVAAALLLGLAGCWCYRRRRRRQQAADAAVAVKDVELGPGSAEFGSDASKGARDQTLSDDGCGKVR